jgi:hypothetical protein
MTLAKPPAAGPMCPASDTGGIDRRHPLIVKATTGSTSSSTRQDVLI